MFKWYLQDTINSLQSYDLVRTLYLARTTSSVLPQNEETLTTYNDLFHAKNDPDSPSTLKFNMLKDEISKHKDIRIGPCQWWRAYMQHKSWCYRKCCWNGKKEQNRVGKKLYEKGNQRLTEELNLVSIVK